MTVGLSGILAKDGVALGAVNDLSGLIALKAKSESLIKPENSIGHLLN